MEATGFSLPSGSMCTKLHRGAGGAETNAGVGTTTGDAATAVPSKASRASSTGRVVANVGGGTELERGAGARWLAGGGATATGAAFDATCTWNAPQLEHVRASGQSALPHAMQ